MSLIRKLIYIVVCLGSALCFLTLFNFGTENFQANIQKEIESLRQMVQPPPPRKDTSDQIVP